MKQPSNQSVEGLFIFENRDNNENRDNKATIKLFLSGVRILALNSSIIDAVRIAAWFSFATCGN
jgi:hypothetical protein